MALTTDGKTAGEWLGLPQPDDEPTLLLDGGKGLQLWRDGAQRVSEGVPMGKCFVDQGVSHMVDARVVHDRLVMQEDGIVVATLLVDPATLEGISHVDA